MDTSRIEQLYNQMMHWPERKVQRHLLARSTGTDIQLVVALVLSQLLKAMSRYDREAVNVLEDPSDLADYLIQECLSLSDADKAVIVCILCSIAQENIESVEDCDSKPVQFLLRSCAIICQTFSAQGAELAKSVSKINSVTKKSMNAEDVRLLSERDGLGLLNYKVGQEVLCKINRGGPGGYRVLTMENVLTGFINTSERLKLNSCITAYFICVNDKQQILLSLTPFIRRNES